MSNVIRQINGQKLIVGLGNPGKKYEKTRHNLGFMVVDELAKKLKIDRTTFVFNKKFNAETAKIKGSSVCPSAAELRVSEANPDRAKRGSLRQATRTTDEPFYIILTKPQTFMNNSGLAVAKIANFYKIKTPDIWVIYDDIDLPLGILRIRQNGSSGGHKGVQSIIDSLGSSDFARFRLGVGPVPLKFDPADFVLKAFDKSEPALARDMAKKAVEAVFEKMRKDVLVLRP
ncbi:MAG: aminoacyl-tRNA hydrolase [Patescibacteria group bacterium]